MDLEFQYSQLVLDPLTVTTVFFVFVSCDFGAVILMSKIYLLTGPADVLCL